MSIFWFMLTALLTRFCYICKKQVNKMNNKLKYAATTGGIYVMKLMLLTIGIVSFYESTSVSLFMEKFQFWIFGGLSIYGSMHFYALGLVYKKDLAEKLKHSLDGDMIKNMNRFNRRKMIRLISKKK